MTDGKNKHNPKKMTPKKMAEARIRNSIRLESEAFPQSGESGSDDALEKLIFDCVYKYGTDEYIEEQSADFESNLLVHFFKLARIEDYRNINEREAEAQSLKPDDYLSSSLSESPHMKVVKAIVEDYQSNWELFLSDRLFQQHLDAQNGLEDSPNCEDYKRSDNYKRDRNTKLNLLTERVLAATAPSLDEVWKSDKLLEFSSACFDNALELGVISLSVYRVGDHNLAWLALMKAREFLGTFVGARVQVVKGTNRAIQGLTSGLARQRTMDFARASVLSKMKQVLEHPQNLHWFKHKAAWESSDLAAKVREEWFIDDLVENVLLPVYKQARGLEISPLGNQDGSDKTHTMIEDWIHHDPEFKEAFSDLAGCLLKDRHYHAQKALESTISEDSDEKDTIKISRHKFRQLIAELEINWDSYDARFLGCPADKDCAYRQQEEKRLNELRKSFDGLFKLDEKKA